MLKHDWKREILTIPNLLTTLRLLLIPVYTALYLAGKYQQSAAVLGVACLTDFADGYVARKFGMSTLLGRILDPIADKATQFTLLICVSVRYEQLRSVLLLFVIKESFQALAGVWFLRMGKVLSGALLAGKACTTVLFVSLLVLVLFPGIGAGAVTALANIDTGFLAIAFATYFAAYFGNSNKLVDYKA